MSNKQIVIDFVSKLPDEASLSEIARKIDFLAGIQAAEEEAERGEVVSADEARALIDQWARR